MIVLKNADFIRITCPSCRSRLGVHKNDIHYNDIFVNYEFSSICEVCTHIIPISGAMIPRRWIRDIVPDDSGH